MIKILLIFTLIFSLYANDELYDAFKRGDYKTAFKILKKASNRGDANAQYNLALMYYQGDGVEQNISKTAQLLESSAQKGNKKAIENIGRIYMQILDFDKASYWLEKNAKNGDKEAYYLLSEIYCEKEKFKLAKKWAKKSIENGNLDAKDLWDRYKLQDY